MAVVVSARLNAPVVSFMTASPPSSGVAQELLRDLFSIQPIPLNDHKDDELDQTLKIPILGRSWNSVASKCTSSGTVFHFLSLSASSSTNTSDAKENRENGGITLVGITDSDTTKSPSDADLVVDARRFLASHISRHNNNFAKPLRLVLNHAAGRQIFASDITGLQGGLPLLEFPLNGKAEPRQNHQAGLKEIAIPFYDDSLYPNGQSLLSFLGSSLLSRPAVGLYQWPDDGLVIRPIPSAKEDRTLPAPSLVFYSDNLDEAASKLAKVGAVSAKIGHNGLEKSGQLMVSHPALLGLDIRVTDSTTFTSAFPEAQEALLASSLGELQNVNVFVKGGKEDVATRSKVDTRDNEGDCWVEFRANMKHPSRFMKKRSSKGKRAMKIAKPPDLPFE